MNPLQFALKSQMGVLNLNMAKSNPPNATKDFFPSPALSLSLAGIFRGAAAAAEVEEGDEGSGGGVRETTVEISSENSGMARSRSDEEFVNPDEVDDGDEPGGSKRKKRKKYHRHTADQIREMESLFKESPHPDERQRQELSKRLGLHPSQVKFWFQNRRTQIKAIQERHENSLLKSEIDKLKDESKSLRETIHKGCCPNCGFTTTTTSISKDSPSLNSEDQQLRIENSRLKSEVDKLKTMLGKNPQSAASPSPSNSTVNDHENKSSSEFYNGVFRIEKSKIMERVEHSLEELKRMASAKEPLWVKSVETAREILNYDEYVQEFSGAKSTAQWAKLSIEASRDTALVFMDLPRLLQCFMDVNQLKEMFPCLISKAATVDIINNGEGPNRNGAVQLMFVEMQMLTPMVTTREVYFVRHCKQLSPEQWAIVDVSIDDVEDNIDASLVKCRKRPSGCVIEDTSNGHCKVTWVEHLECQKSAVHSMYRTLVSSGLAFGARHWLSTLQLECERLVFYMATNVPTKDSSGVATFAGRKSILKLARRMTWSFCRALGASSLNTWTKVATKTGEDVRISCRKNLNDPGEPVGVILCAVSSVWLPVPPNVLFEFLRDDARRHEWDAMANGGQAELIANLAKGKDRGNAVSIQALNSKENNKWVLQESCTNAYESMVVYAPVDLPGMQPVMTGCDSSGLAILPSGFSILPDGVESRPLVITSRQDEDKGSEGGSLLTIALQLVTNTSPTTKLSMESVESVNTLICCTLKNIKASLQCEDG